MKFGGKRRLQKEQERFEKQQAQKKKNKKQITIWCQSSPFYA
jgi:hypothetical protein